MENTYTLADIYRIVVFLKNNPRTNTSRWAVITSSPLAAAGYVYQKSMASVHRLEVFSSAEAACSFMGWNQPRPAATGHLEL